MKRMRVVGGVDHGSKPAKQPQGWITEATIRALRVDPRAECRVADGDKAAAGLGVRKRTKGTGEVSLSFNFVARLENGQVANITIGTVGVDSIDEAREQARKLRKWVSKGYDPRVKLLEEQAGKRATEAAATEADEMTLAKAVQLKLDDKELREGTKKQYRALLSKKSRVSLHKLRDRKLDSISRKEWRTILERVRQAYGPASPQPAVVRRTVAALYRNAIAASDFLKLDNPIAELRAGEFADPKNRRTDRLEANQLLGWFRQLNHHDETIANLAKLYLFTGMRDQEARLLTWDEVKPDSIHLPKNRTKTHRDLLLPRTPAIDLLLASQEPYKGIGPYVFPAVLPRPGEGPTGRFHRPVSSILPVLKQMGTTVHGMRRTAATFMDQIEVPENVRRHILNHTPDISRGYVVRDLSVMRQWLTKYHAWIKDWLEVGRDLEQMPDPTEAEWREVVAHDEKQAAEYRAEWAEGFRVD